MSPLRLLALDLGAESGRAVAGTFDGSSLAVEEVQRFPNVPVRVSGTLYWDILRLFGDVLSSIDKASTTGDMASVAVDAWGVDFGLLDKRGRLVKNPVHYRDERTRGMVERATGIIPPEEIYARTGIQFLPINTLYQLLSMVESCDDDLERSSRLLFIPDLLNHFLCGSDVSEYTIASTSQCLDVASGQWATDLLVRLGIPTHLFANVVPPATVLGTFGGLTVVAPAEHDTACAVAGTPLRDERSAYLSSGTWSLLGVECECPIISSTAREANLTNEGGVSDTVRLLKNVMGLWLVQEARRALGNNRGYEDLMHDAAMAPQFSAFIDPDDERFLRPGDLTSAVVDYCAETAQTAPTDPGHLVRVLLESLALKYALVLDQLERVSGRTIDTVHIVGGGANNALLCQLSADATGRQVMAGPVEATAIGNLAMQAIALGELESVAEARALVSRSFTPSVYEPVGHWSEPRQRFAELLRCQGKLP